jgi:hypothetical protein
MEESVWVGLGASLHAAEHVGGVEMTQHTHAFKRDKRVASHVAREDANACVRLRFEMVDELSTSRSCDSLPCDGALRVAMVRSSKQGH